MLRMAGGKSCARNRRLFPGFAKRCRKSRRRSLKQRLLKSRQLCGMSLQLAPFPATYLPNRSDRGAQRRNCPVNPRSLVPISSSAAPQYPRGSRASGSILGGPREPIRRQKTKRDRSCFYLADCAQLPGLVSSGKPAIGRTGATRPAGWWICCSRLTAVDRIPHHAPAQQHWPAEWTSFSSVSTDGSPCLHFQQIVVKYTLCS